MTNTIENTVDEENARANKKETIKIVDKDGKFIGKAIVDYFISSGTGKQFDEEGVAVAIKKRITRDGEVIQEHFYERVSGIDYRKIDVLVKGKGI